MRKQQVKHLEEQFTNLFVNQPQKITPPETPESISHPFDNIQFHQVAYTETESEEDFLDQVDHVLGHKDEKEGQSSRRQIMLNFKINELTVTCKNLKSTNSALTKRITQLQQQRSSSVMKESNIQNSKGDLTFIQQDFIELQQQLSSYKAQLAKYQQKMSAQLDHQQRELDQLRLQTSEVKNLRNFNQILQKQMSEKDRIIGMLESRNEELLMELQRQQDEKFMKKDSLSDKIEAEMQSMIDKLLKQLKIQKKNAAKQVTQIKRLNSQILELENTLKNKNKKIYQLEFNLIKLGKKRYEHTSFQGNNNMRIRDNEKSPLKQEYHDHPYSQRLHNPLYFGKKPEKDEPQRLKSNNSNRSFEKNRVSPERQIPLGRSSGQQSLRTTGSKKMQTFTLMDLLNKQFKVRQVEKQIIVCRIIDLYSLKIMHQNFENLIPEEIQVYNFNPQQLTLLQVRASPMNSKEDRSEVNESGMLYNMAFILDTLLNQVDVIDGFVENPLDLNVIDYVSQLESKQSREEKYKFLQELSGNIETYCLNH